MAETRHPASHAAGEEKARFLHGIPRPAIEEELTRVLSSHEFRTSKRCQDFLRYVVETTLDGRGEQLKERTIGVDVFGRSVEYEPSDDATVRVKAGEVRKRLGLYYAGAGKANALHIEIPGGAYVPDFRFAVADTSVTSIVNTAPATKTRRFGLKNFYIIGALAAVTLLMLVLYAPGHTQPRSVLDDFWEPVFQQAETPVVLSAAYVPVYTPTHPPSEGAPKTAADFTLLTDQFVGGGDMLAIESLASMLNKMHRRYQVRIGTEASFSDLRTSPTVLVGYSYTRWKDLSKEMRFFIDADRRPLMVLDNGKPSAFAIPNLTPEKHTNEDYAIISRVFQTETRTLLVEIAGITQYGTTAAAELVTSADLLQEALGSAPRGWQKKNLQLVVHTRVIAGVAASPRVVASHFW